MGVMKNMLPTPAVHYEMIRQNAANPMWNLPDSIQAAILFDPDNRTGLNPMPIDTVSAYSTTYNMLRSAIGYRLSGQQVVVLGPRMQEAFAHTSLKEVSTDHVRLPHNCFYLATPGSKLKLWGGSHTQWHAISGAYIMVDPTDPDLLSFLIWGEANELSSGPTDDATFWFSIQIHDPKSKNMDVDQKFCDGLKDDELQNGTLRNIQREADFVRLDADQRIAMILDDQHNDVSDYGTPSPEDDGVLEEVKTSIKAFLRVAINTILFLNSTSCEVKSGDDTDAKRRDLTAALGRKKHKNGKDAKKLTRDLDKLPTYKVTWIGPTIEQSVDSPTDLTSTRTVKGHVRRGHWHTYRLGPRKDASGDRIEPATRKADLKWLPPLWVAGGSDDDKPRVYGVREPITP